MRPIVLLVSMAACLGAAVAQTPPSSSSTKSSAAAASAPNKAATAMAHKPAASASTLPPWIRLPPGVPRVMHGPVKIGLALHYEDIKIGTGAPAESGKLWHIKYTGWRAADGVKFDSWDDHRRPEIKDGKPVMGPDGKPVLGDPEPLEFPQGMGRVIPGFDYALEGMRIGGKRRIFIPWQLAYGTRTIPDRPDHPGIPAKSDLIFDVELVAVTDLPAPMERPMFPPHPVPPPHPGAPPEPAHPGAPAAPGTAPATPNAAPKPAAPSSAPSTQQPSTPQPPSSTTVQPQPH